MAFSTEDGTSNEVLSQFTLPGGATAGYVRIGRVDIDWTELTYTAQLRVYVSREARDNDPYCGKVQYLGGALTQSQIDEMATTDVRDVLYPDLERLMRRAKTRAGNDGHD